MSNNPQESKTRAILNTLGVPFLIAMTPFVLMNPFLIRISLKKIAAIKNETTNLSYSVISVVLIYLLILAIFVVNAIELCAVTYTISHKYYNYEIDFIIHNFVAFEGYL